MTKVPNKTVTMAVKFTRKASDPYLSRPVFSRNVSFSRYPKVAVATAKTYTKVPKSTCHGSDSLLIDGVPPGKKNTMNP